jgi:hypothetical protein
MTRERIINLHDKIKDTNIVSWQTKGRMSNGERITLEVYIKCLNFINNNQYFLNKDLLAECFRAKIKKENVPLKATVINKNTLDMFLYKNKIGIKTILKITAYLGLDIDDFIFIKN